MGLRHPTTCVPLQLLYLSHKFDNNCAEVMIPELLRHNARQDILNRDGYTCLVTSVFPTS